MRNARVDRSESSERSRSESLMVEFHLLKGGLCRTPISQYIVLMAIISDSPHSEGSGFPLTCHGLGIATSW